MFAARSVLRLFSQILIVRGMKKNLQQSLEINIILNPWLRLVLHQLISGTCLCFIYFAKHFLVHSSSPSFFPALLKAWPFQFVRQYRCDTCLTIVESKSETICSSLDDFRFLDIFGGVRVPYHWGISQYRI